MIIKAVILDADSLHPSDLSLDSLLSQPFDWTVYGATTPDQIVDRCEGASLILSNKVMITAEAMDAAPELKMIAVLATGTNNVDHSAAKARDIKIINAVAYGTSSVVQHCWSLILALTTHLNTHEHLARASWHNSNFFCAYGPPVFELGGKTLGIVGYGELGSGVARIGRAFGMQIVAADLRGVGGRTEDGVRRLPLHDVLSLSDVISLHCPLVPETKNLIDEAELGAMKETAILVNCARGGIVNEDALAEALRSGEIAGAGVDVLSQEPPPHDHVLLGDNVPNLIVTPHIAWGAVEARQRLVDQIAGKIEMFFAQHA